MHSKIKTVIKYLAVWVLVILPFSVCLADKGITAHAEESAFVIDADLLMTGNATYDVSITVENLGGDWEGTVRLMADSDYYRQPTAYDTVISLPQGSTKQFVVKIPKKENSAEGTVRISLLDKKSNKVAEKEFKRLLKADAKALAMGILSDDYAALTYLDMGGDDFYFKYEYYPIRLVELNRDSLGDSLDSLTFLVIDNYNTGVLTDEDIKKIELWVDNGGVLIIGTGSYAENTLKGFDSLNIECRQNNKSDEDTDSYIMMDEDTTSYTMDVDISKLDMAELVVPDASRWDYKMPITITCSQGDGAIGVLCYSLCGLGKLNSSDYNYGMTQEQFVMEILNQVSGNASSRFGGSGYNSYDYTYMIDSIFSVLGNCNSPLNFGALKFIVILYVIFAGPVLYLILRFAKKREIYWLVVPATAFVAIILVYLAGRGFEVVSTRVYSVTVENFSDRADNMTYMYCYDANHKEWDLRLDDNYEYIGPWPNSGYSFGEEENYYYHIKKEGDELFFGVKPSKNFDDSYFIAGKTTQRGNGNIVNDGVISGWSGAVYGTVTNDTDCDFRYFAVITDGILYIYGNLPAGESCELQTTEALYTNNQSWRNDVCNAYLYDFLYESFRDKEKEETSAIAALGIGICSAYTENDTSKTFIIGVTEDWDKVVDDNCGEISYGCLYTVQ